MTVWVDSVRHYPHARTRRKHFCHMVCDGDIAELHAMADALGLKREWLHRHRTLPHYDLPPETRERAIELGARPITRKALVDLLVRARAEKHGAGPA